MEKWILAIAYDSDKFVEAQTEWLKYHVFIQMEASIQDAMQTLSKHNNYVLVAIFSSLKDYLTLLPMLRDHTRAPILIMKHQYDGNEKIAALEAGADEFIEWPESVIESVASGRALIRRYTELNQPDNKMHSNFSSGEVFISLDYHKVFVHTKEIQLPRREFDLFYLLVSNPNRVFNSEQLYQKVWGTDYIPTDDSLYSCIHRIRSKLDLITETSCQIHNKRGVGYYFSQNNT